MSHMVRDLAVWGVPYGVTAIADPRAAEIQARTDPLLQDAAFYESADELLANESGRLDGIMIGTRCRLHTEMACKVAPTGLPLFLEKPVAITFDQVQQLAQSWQHADAPVVVSFPLRLSPIVQTVKEIVDSGQIGTVENVVA
ncbi:MAG: Gfo/Idh/MocA family oxidoreductase, partial [Caldilineaceae bacterium]|nr:Gfo/Idh/MocA family oxidoreductase [Caldilineaceae bacterium]